MAGGVFYNTAQSFVIEELNRRKNAGYMESRKLNGCYITINSRRVEPVVQNYQDLDTGEAALDLLGQAGRQLTDVFTGGMSDSLFGQSRESEAMETKQKVVGNVVRATGNLSTLSSTDLNSRYATSTRRPTPAIQKLDVEMSGDYGSLKKCVLQIKTFDKASFEELEQKFMIPGTEINMKYGRVGQSGPANNAEFNGVVYDYSFKLNEYLGYDCEIKAVAKGSLVTELNAMAKVDDKGRTFCSDYEWLNEYQDVANIADVFDYDVQDLLDDHTDLHRWGGTSTKVSGYSNAALAGCDAPNAGPEPENDGMVNGNIAYCTLGYIVNKLINEDLLKGNIEGNATKSREIQFICNDNVTVGKRYDRLFSANPMKILWLGDRTYQQTYGGTGGLGFGAQTFGATKIWGKKFKSVDKVIRGGDKCYLANILISRDCFRAHLGAGGMGAEGSKISVMKFLQAIFQDIYNHSGGAWDLTLTSMTPEVAKEYGEAGGDEFMYVVDKNWAPGRAGKQGKIQLNAARSFTNYARNVSLTGKVPKDMAAAAFVGGSGTASGKKSETVQVIKGEKITTLTNAAGVRNDLLDSMEVIHDTGYNSETISAAKSNLKAYVEGTFSSSEKASFRKDKYPLELSATLDGIAGIQFGNACVTDLAPSRYYDDSPSIVFTVTKTKDSITPNDWITEVDTICRMEQ
tara:strand:- start:938 stop:2995 length:2058 start_codon:yes stop_codon:yes gene_type:complete